MAEPLTPIKLRPSHPFVEATEKLVALRWPLALATIVITIGLAAPFWNVPLNRDQGVYATCADVLLYGGVPYRDCWDTKGPALHYTYALAEILFVQNISGPYILNAITIAATALVIAALAHIWFAPIEWAYGIGLIYGLLAIAVRFDMNAQPESFANFFAMLGILGITQSLRTNKLRFAVISGLGLAFAVFYKYALALPYGIAVLALIFLYPLQQSFTYRWKVIGLMLVGAVGSVVLFAGYLLIVGALDDAILHLRFILFYFPKAQLNPDEYALRSHPLEQTFLYIARLPIIWTAGIVGAVAAGLHRRWYAGGILAFIAAGIIVVWGQQRFTPYHWTVCLPAFALGIGALVYELQQTNSLSRRGIHALQTVISLLVIANIATFFYQDQWLIMGKYITGAESKQQFFETHGVWDHAVAADYIQQRTKPGDKIWVWGHHTAIYSLADRMSPTRFIYNEPLLMHINGGNPWQEEWRADALNDVYRDPPIYILLTTFDRTFFDFQNPNVAWKRIPEYNALTETHYLKEYEFGRFQFYRLIPYWSRQNRGELLDRITLINLVDKFGEVQDDQPSDPTSEVMDFKILNEPAYPTIRMAPPGRLIYTLTLPASPVCLRFDTAMFQDSWSWGGDGASFSVAVTSQDGNSSKVFEETISNSPEDQHWHDHIIDLNQYAGQAIRLSFEIGPGPNGDFTGDWAGWGMPRIVRPPSGTTCDSNAIVDARSH